MGKYHLTPYKRRNGTISVPKAPRKKPQKTPLRLPNRVYTYNPPKRPNFSPTKTKTVPATPMRDMNGGSMSRFRYRHKKSKIYKGFKLMSSPNRYYTNGTVRISQLGGKQRVENLVYMGDTGDRDAMWNIIAATPLPGFASPGTLVDSNRVAHYYLDRING